VAIKKKKSVVKPGTLVGYDSVLSGVAELLEAARRTTARATNAVMTATYWEIGRRIVEREQRGGPRADYGRELINRLGADLSKKFGRGFGWRNLYQMRSFYLAYPEILQTLSAKFAETVLTEKSPTLSGEFSAVKLQTPPAKYSIADIAACFQLPWSHYVLLLSVKNHEGRAFYEAEALRGGWSVRQLNRQINSQFYERTALSRNKAAILKKGTVSRPEDILSPEEEIKDPFVLEFLGLKDEYSECDLEGALIKQLENFLLELGGDFTFVGRQRRLRVGDEWYRVDLLFYHRRLRCLVIIDLKLGKFTHADAGQMHLYLNYAREHWTHHNENPPVGLILCAQKDHAIAKYALEGLRNKVMAAEYKTVLPAEKTLVEEIERTRNMLERRQKERR
jgi:predicted nuclease of restriction endonuclease-like (RecB) superfamily